MGRNLKVQPSCRIEEFLKDGNSVPVQEMAAEFESRLLELRQDLRAQIAAARSAMQLPPLPNLRTAPLTTLRRIWRDTVIAARAAGLIE